MTTPTSSTLEDPPVATPTSTQEDRAPHSAPATPPVTTPRSRCKHLLPLRSLSGKLGTFGARFKRKTATGSFEESISTDDSFYVIKKSEVPPSDHTPDHTPSCTHLSAEEMCGLSFDSTMFQYGRDARDRSWTMPECNADSDVLSSPGSPDSTHSLTTCDQVTRGIPTYKWTLKRKEFIDPIFNHTNKIVEKKFRVKAGAKRSRCGLTFVLKLYPNGVNWDQDSFSSLHVEVVPSALCTNAASIVYLSVLVVGGEQVLSHRRKVCRLQEEKRFMFDQFLAHDVVKTSKANKFYVLFNVQLSYRLGEGWVCIGDKSEHTQEYWSS